MNIDDLTGMFLEKDMSWRRGQEDIIWVHSKKYAYALQEPAEPYKAIWNGVLSDWQNSHGGRSGAFRVVNREQAKPSWWVGQLDWKALVAYKDEDEDEDEDEGDDDDEDEDEDMEERKKKKKKWGKRRRRKKRKKKSKRKKKKEKTRMRMRMRTRAKARARARARVPARGRARTRLHREAPAAPGPELRRRSSLRVKGKAAATVPEETDTEDPGSPPVVPSRRRQGTSGGRAGRSPHDSSDRPSKKVRIASTPDEGPSVFASSEGGPSCAGPSGAQPSGAGPSKAGSSGAGPSGRKTRLSTANATGSAPLPEPSAREAAGMDEDPKPSKRARSDSSSGKGKGKQKASAPDKLAMNTPASSSRDSAVRGDSPHAQPSGSTSYLTTDGRMLPAEEWQARRTASVSHHESMRAVNSQLDPAGTSQGAQPHDSARPTPQAGVHGSFPPPTSSPVTPLTEWTTRPLTQVAPSTLPTSLEARDNGGAEEQGEVDMSLSSGGGEEATERGSIEPPENSRTGGNEPSGVSSARISEIEAELSKAQDLLTRVRSRGTASLVAPTGAEASTGPPASTVQGERLVQGATTAVQHAAEVLRHVTGCQVELDLPTAGQVDGGSQPGVAPPAVSTATLQAPAIAGPSTQQEDQGPERNPRDLEDIGNRMSDLDLANRAPVRAGRQPQPRGSATPQP
ncbi:hypothetical protein FRC11_009790 [Ceratobasidium sp. 423]|nr:hypothetical protein FRC11_009790 [Ceratobasidium sp. 423]